LEGNHYFPPDSVDWNHLSATRMRSVCPWKGLARYYTVKAGGQEGRNAAWAYPQPLPWIRKIRGHVAFWGGVEVRPFSLVHKVSAGRPSHLSRPPPGRT
ncbi:MAG: DUF427 domain-containing protein, partial [Thermoleophilaceae bacterium]